MGSFFTNVQVRAGQVGVANTLAIVLDAVRQRVCGQGYRLARAGEEPDRTVAVAAHEASPWIGVFDQDTEEHDRTRLEGWAKDLSRASSSSAVAVLVHDSDVLELALWRRGRRVDGYCSRPGHFAASLTLEQRRRARGHPERWKDLLRGGASVETLGEMWAANRLFAEETLAATAALLGWDAARCGAGFRTIQQVNDVERVHFRALDRPANESLRAGPARLVSTAALHGFDGQAMRLVVGDSMRLDATCTSVGGAEVGVCVSAWGPAIDAGLVEPESAHVTLCSPGRGDTLRARLRREGTRLVASFPGASIPAGLAYPVEQALRDTNPFMRAWKATQGTQIHVLVHGTIHASGQGALHVGVKASGAEAEATTTTVLTVAPPLRRPMRCAPSVESHLLLPMLQPTRLVAVVALGGDRAASAAFCGRAMERWSQWSATAGASYVTTTMLPDGRARPKVGKLAAKTIPKGKRWKDLRASFSTVRGFQASIRADGVLPFEGEVRSADMLSRTGFSMGVAPYPQNEAADPSLVHLGLWMDLPGRGTEQAARGRAVLRAILDEAVGEQGAPQGFLARWSWTPAWMDTTPYEVACGIHGQCTMKRSWCTRYLRAVAEDGVWVGRALLDTLGDAADVEDVAERTDVGGGMRLDLREGRKLEALERALAPLLPSSKDWERETRAMYDAEGEQAFRQSGR